MDSPDHPKLRQRRKRLYRPSPLRTATHLSNLKEGHRHWRPIFRRHRPQPSRHLQRRLPLAHHALQNAHELHLRFRRAAIPHVVCC